MSCYLCGHEETHHLGCARIANPVLTPAQAVQLGLMPKPVVKEKAPEVVEVLKEGTMTTVLEEDVPAKGGETVGQCEFEGCKAHKFSASPRAKYCAEHKDPKNRKE